MKTAALILLLAILFPHNVIASEYFTGKVVSIESYNYPGNYIRHAYGLGEITEISSDLDKQDSTFKIVPGLADGDGNIVSFESLNYPGQYLRHQDGRIKLQLFEDSQQFRDDASFVVTTGLANPTAVSFESYNFLGSFIRHKEGHLYIDKGTDDLFLNDATFRISELNIQSRYEPVNNFASEASTVEYITFYDESVQRFAWVGQNVVFLTVRGDLDPEVMGKLCSTFDKVYDFYRGATDREPSSAKTYEGRTTIAEVENTCGACCGILGKTGIEMGPDYFRGLYDGVAQRNEYDQSLPYEFGRNFWFYSPQLAYQEGADSGSVITGYAVFMRFLALDAAGVKVGPFGGYSGDEFRGEVENLVDLYVSDPSLSWENTLKIGKAPQNRMGLGGADLFASFCLRLCRDFGGPSYAGRLWQEVGRRPEARSTEDAIDNFVLAASVAAGEDLTSVFADTWRWPVSDAAKQEAEELFSL